MPARIALILLLLSMGGAILAEVLSIKVPKLVTSTGKEYFDVTIKEKTAEGIRVTHKYGLGLIRFDELPEHLVKQLGGFDAEEATQAKKARLAANSKAQKRIALATEEAARIAAEQAMLATAKREHAAKIARIKREAEEAKELLRRQAASRSYLQQGYRVPSSSRGYSPGAPRSRPSSSSRTSQRCEGYTEKGFRCKRMTTVGIYCYQHP